MAKANLPTTTSAEMAKMFLVHFVINAGVIFLANMLFPQFVVLGTSILNHKWSLILSMGALTLITVFVVPVFEYIQEKKGEALDFKFWMGGYLLVNFVGLWVITRFAEQFGLGIAAWWVGLILAAVLDFVQGLGVMVVYKDRK